MVKWWLEAMLHNFGGRKHTRNTCTHWRRREARHSRVIGRRKLYQHKEENKNNHLSNFGGCFDYIKPKINTLDSLVLWSLDTNRIPAADPCSPGMYNKYQTTRRDWNTIAHFNVHFQTFVFSMETRCASRIILVRNCSGTRYAHDYSYDNRQSDELITIIAHLL